MSPEQIDLLVKILPAVIIAVIGGIANVILAVKSGKWKNLFFKTPAVNTHTQKLIELIVEAEKHTAYNGQDKLAFVVTHYVKYCIENKIQYDEEAVKENVESLVEMTKTVNTGKSRNSQEY